MLTLDIKQALYFLDCLDSNARHTIASEAPFGRNGLPKWEVGATYEHNQQQYMIADIVERQKRGSNIYYSVNRPCKVTERQGLYGKNNIDDILAIRALGFDIDTLESKETVLKLINEKLYGELIPSMVIATGGGYHLIYFIRKIIEIDLYRPPKNDEEKERNEMIFHNRSFITELAKDFEHMLRDIFPSFKIDSMSNIDRVLRLPGTINFPKAEKQAKGQQQAVARIILETNHKTEILPFRSLVPKLSEERSQIPKKPYAPSKNAKTWSGYMKAKACCEFIRDNGLADTNEWYTHNVMLPLIGAIHDENEYNNITLEEAEELFMLAISGGTRYNTMGRGDGYFMRQWRSHRPEYARNGTKSLGGLIWAVKEAGYVLPWAGEKNLDEDAQRQLAEMRAEKQVVDDDTAKKYSSG